MTRRIGKLGIGILVLVAGTNARGDTVSCLYDCQKAYDACMKTPASTEYCLKQLTECKGRCAAQPE